MKEPEHQEESRTEEQEVAEAERKSHVSPATNAFFIGFLIGIVVYSVAVNSWGILTLIPLYLAYKLIKSG